MTVASVALKAWMTMPLSVQFRREVTVDTMLAEHREVRILISLSLQNYY